MKRSNPIRCLAKATTAAMGLTAASAGAAPPPFQPDRTAENHSYLADPARRGDWSDGYKFIPLDADGRSYLSLGGELRERVEMFDSPRFGLGGAVEDTYLLQRVLVHADFHAGESVRLFAQVGAHEAFGKILLSPPDEDHLDLHQLFAELRPSSRLSVRIGRQEMMFNPTQRFVSFRDGTNVRQNFDGARLTWTRGPLRAEAFITRPVLLERGVFDDEGNRDQMFAGAYFSHRLGDDRAASFDGYWLMLDRESLGTGPTARERRHSLGGRYAGTRGRLDWDAEAVHQFGRSTGRGISAWAASADLGYTLSASSLKPRFGLRFDSGSGDSDAAGGPAAGFFPLFPSGPYFNEANLTSWTNLIAVRPSLRIQPEPRLTLQAAIQLKWREETADAVYLGPSSPLPATLGNRAREIGQVYTIDGNFQLNRNLGLRAYYLRHTAGDAIAAAGGRAITFVMGSATLRF